MKEYKRWLIDNGVQNTPELLVIKRQNYINEKDYVDAKIILNELKKTSPSLYLDAFIRARFEEQNYKNGQDLLRARDEKAYGDLILDYQQNDVNTLSDELYYFRKRYAISSGKSKGNLILADKEKNLLYTSERFNLKNEEFASIIETKYLEEHDFRGKVKSELNNYSDKLLEFFKTHGMSQLDIDKKCKDILKNNIKFSNLNGITVAEIDINTDAKENDKIFDTFAALNIMGIEHQFKESIEEGQNAKLIVLNADELKEKLFPKTPINSVLEKQRN